MSFKLEILAGMHSIHSITSLDNAVNTSNTRINLDALIAFAVMGADAMYGFLLISY